MNEANHIGILQEPALRALKFSLSEEEIEERLDKSLEELVLEFTQECNFRCDYCIYGGTYLYERKHSQDMMIAMVCAEMVFISSPT